MRRLSALLAAIALLAAACGGGDDAGQEDSDSTAPPTTVASPTTVAPSPADAGTAAPAETTPPDTPDLGSGSSTDFCRSADDLENEDFDFMAIGAAPADLEASINELLSIFDEAAANAPSEIADDMAVLRQAFEGFAALLADYDYDFFAIAQEAENDPRLLAFEGDEIEQAANNIAAFCGFDVDATDDDDVAGPPLGDIPDVMDEGLPAGFPEALVPPGVVSVESFDAAGLQSVNITSSAPFDELVEFYTGVLGAPLGVFDDGTGKVAAFVAELDGSSVNISLSEGDTQLVAIGIIDL